MDTTYSGTTTGGTLPTPQARAPKLYRPGMTQQQFEQALAADPGYQAILRNPANRAPNGQLTPQGWNIANQYAQDAGLGEDGLNGLGRNDVAGAFHGGGSDYSVDGNGAVQESHDSWANPETFGALLGMGIGGYVAAPYVAGALGLTGTEAGATGATTGGTLASTTTVPLSTGTIAGTTGGLTGTTAALTPLAATTTAPLSTAGTTGLLGSTTTVPTSAGTIAGSVPSGTVPAATGSSGGILHTLGRFGDTDTADMLTQGSQAMAAGRRQDTYADMNSANGNNRAILDSAVFNRDLPSVQSSQVARGDLMATMHDAAPTGDPRIDKFSGGGLRPSAFGPSTQQAGDALKRQALTNLMTGKGRITPQLTTPREASGAENAMGYTGTAMNILGTLGRYYS